MIGFPVRGPVNDSLSGFRGFRRRSRFSRWSFSRGRSRRCGRSIVFSGSGVGEEVETGFIGELSSISEDEVTKTGVGLGETET